MKKIFIALIAFFGLTVAFAQVTVPNAGFEEWTDNTHPAGLAEAEDLLLHVIIVLKAVTLTVRVENPVTDIDEV